jgi:hypothetical protein
MTTALERLKKDFPDWPDWPQGAVEATVKMMQEYGRDVGNEALERASEDIDPNWGQITLKARILLTKVDTP